MKYFIANNDSKQFTEKREKLQQIFSDNGIEKDDNLEEIKNKKDEEICRGVISRKSMLDKFSKYFTLFIEDDEKQNIVGILIFDINLKYSFIKIHYLCSKPETKYKGNGKVLLDKIKDIATNAEISQIVLTPGPHEKIIEFYEKYGFEENRENRNCEMVYEIKRGGKTRKTRKINKKTLKRRA